MTETEFQKIIDDYRDENQRLNEMIDIKEQKIEQYKKSSRPMNIKFSSSVNTSKH